MSFKITTNAEDVGEFVGNILENKGWSPFAGIGLKRDNELIAGVVYDNYNGTNIFAHIAAKGARWVTKDFLWYMHHYPFTELGVDRVTGQVGSKNHKVIKFMEHLGAHKEATLKGAHPDGDLLLYCLFKKDCKYLGKR